MDWIRLTKTTPDLAGTNGIMKRVTYEELAKHNKEDDCWLAIFGSFYFFFSSSFLENWAIYFQNDRQSLQCNVLYEISSRWNRRANERSWFKCNQHIQ